MKYYIIAGEASGDLHGSNLMKGIYAEDPHAEIRFWGGDLMLNVYNAGDSSTAQNNPSHDVVAGLLAAKVHRTFGQSLASPCGQGVARFFNGDGRI
jgi:lipid-A-disaccharide synthase